MLESRVATVTTPEYPNIFMAHVAAMIAKKCLTLQYDYLGGNADLWDPSGVKLFLLNEEGR